MAFLSFVIPAKAGIQSCRGAPVALDPSPDLIRGFRRGDGKKEGATILCDKPRQVGASSLWRGKGKACRDPASCGRIGCR